MAVTDQIKDAVPDTIKDNVPTSLQEAVPNAVKEAFGSAKEAVGLDGGYSSGGPSTSESLPGSHETEAGVQWKGPQLTRSACAEATRAEMSAAKLPLAYRDSCAHLLIPLNKCRPDNWYMPWRCVVRIWRTIEGW